MSIPTPLRAAKWALIGAIATVSLIACSPQYSPSENVTRYQAAQAPKTTRFIAFGDWGTGAKSQFRLADQMAAHHAKDPFSFALLLGDNFYPNGVKDENDPYWTDLFQKPYAPLLRAGVNFYATLGNHDIRTANGAGQLTYAKKNPQWVLPNPYYRFSDGDVDFFAVDGNEGHFDAAQQAWLDRALASSQKTWRVVFGHFPLRSNGIHGDSKWLHGTLKPILEKHKVDLYLAGHDHDIEFLPPENGVHAIVAGGGGAMVYPLKPWGKSLYRGMAWSFISATATSQSMQIKAIDDHGKELYQMTLKPNRGI